MFIPVTVLTVSALAGLQRISRGNMLEELRKQYIITARAKGLPEHRVIYGHALRNAINPLITLFGYEFSSLLSGAALLEIIINWPGLGSLMLSAVRSQDTFLVMGSMLMGGSMLIIGNFIADMLLIIVDPRVRKG
jgi:peptide/nickel transport system permease protein